MHFFGLEGKENLVPIKIRSLDRPDHSESLYGVSYPGRLLKKSTSSYLTDRRLLNVDFFFDKKPLERTDKVCNGSELREASVEDY